MKSLFSKLLIRFILITLIIIMVFGFSLIYFFKGFYFSIREDEIINNGQVISKYLSEAIMENDLQNLQKWLEIIAKQNNGQAWLVDDEGDLILTHPIVADEGDLIVFERYEDVFNGEIVSRRIESSYFERPMVLVGLPISGIDNFKYGLLIFTSVAGINSIVSRVQRFMIYFSLFVELVVIIIAYFWSKTLSEPLKRMNMVALQLSNGEFGKTIEVEGNNEIGHLANSINYMSKTLKETIDNLVTEKNKLKYILTGIEEGVLAVNEEKEVILINSAARKLLDIEDKDVNGFRVSNLIDKTEVSELLRRTIKEKENFQIELHFKIKQTERRILIRSTPIYKDEENLWGVVALFQDISDRWRFEQLQRDFIANVSHELKAPLSSIKGAGEILLDKVVVDPDKQGEYLEMIIEETDRLGELVNDVLALSELDASTPNYKKTNIDVKKLLISVSKVFKKMIKKDDYSLQIVFAKNHLFICGNEERLKQVLLNLLENAYKFSCKGGIIEFGAEEEKDEVKFWVKDQGKGIPLLELENIWERFYKVDKAHTPDQKGSGLGLAIVKQIIEESGGRVFVESKYKQGSVFGFYLPKIEGCL